MGRQPGPAYSVVWGTILALATLAFIVLLFSGGTYPAT